MALAEEHGLDLVQISESNETVIARIMDFGKFLYEKKKQQGEAKKNQKVIQIKEIKVRPQIETNDYLVKMGKCFEFLKEGKRVKFSLQLRGRENITLVDKVQEIFQRIQQDIDKEFGANIIKEPLQKANSLYSMVVYLK